ncbi:hypothetical protein ACOMHN_060823 [Nucella lapillus]
MASEGDNSSQPALPTYEEAVSSPAYSPHAEACPCPSYDVFSLSNPSPPPPYSVSDTLSNSPSFPDSLRARIGGLQRSTSKDEQNGNGNTSPRVTSQCMCTLLAALGYTETECSCLLPSTDSHYNPHFSSTVSSRNAGEGAVGEETRLGARGWQENLPLCCRKDRQKEALGFVFSCGMQGACPCGERPTEGEGEGGCQCHVGRDIPTSTTTTTSNLSYRACRLWRKVKQRLEE